MLKSTTSKKKNLETMSPNSLTPFSFTLLSNDTSSNKENMIEVNLISKLSSPLPLLKKTITAPDGTEVEDMLQWIEKLAMYKRAWKVMEKKIYATNVNDHHNRFMISKHIVEKKIKLMMTKEEIEVANLNSNERFHGGERQTVGKKRGRGHEGLEVMVYDNNGQGYKLYLTRWDSSEASVLKGANYKEFHRRSNLAAGDLIEMWAFKDGANKLCFVIGKKLDLKLSL